MPAGVQEALELHSEIARHGWAFVVHWRTWHFSQREAEAMYYRLDWLKEQLPRIIEAYRGQGGV